VLDGDGIIVTVNRAWRRFAADNGDPELTHCGPGSNYLAVCNANATQDADDGAFARQANDGLRAVLEGRSHSFSMQYPCRLEDRTLSFLMHAAPIEHPAGGILVSHIDITSLSSDAKDGAGYA